MTRPQAVPTTSTPPTQFWMSTKSAHQCSGQPLGWLLGFLFPRVPHHADFACGSRFSSPHPFVAQPFLAVSLGVLFFYGVIPTALAGPFLPFAPRERRPRSGGILALPFLAVLRIPLCLLPTLPSQHEYEFPHSMSRLNPKEYEECSWDGNSSGE